MPYRILQPQEAPQLSSLRQPIDWPIAQLEVGQSFLIPMSAGVDAKGRHEDTVRALVCKFNKKLQRRFSCRKVEGGLLVLRTA